MADIDPSRATFVQTEWRWTTGVIDANVKTRNPAARVVELPTNLDEAAANRIANAILVDNSAPRSFEVNIQGVYITDSMIASVPCFQLFAAAMAAVGRTLKLGGFRTDLNTQITTLQVRG